MNLYALSMACPRPQFRRSPLASLMRRVVGRSSTRSEIRESQAEVMLLLGDEPIRWLLATFDQRRRSLSDFGSRNEAYGRRHKVNFDGHRIEVVALAHPRQAAGLGGHSPEWRQLHETWTREVAPPLL